MSTRATISIHDPERINYGNDCFGPSRGNTYYIYRHSDGYPFGEFGVVAELTKALPYAWELPRFQAADFAAAIVAAWKDGSGNIYFAQGHKDASDSEYQYYVTEKKGKVHVVVQDVGFGNEDDRERSTLFEGYLEDAIEHFAEWPEE